VEARCRARLLAAFREPEQFDTALHRALQQARLGDIQLFRRVTGRPAGRAPKVGRLSGISGLWRLMHIPLEDFVTNTNNRREAQRRRREQETRQRWASARIPTQTPASNQEIKP
jgi:hypothetical protein